MDAAERDARLTLLLAPGLGPTLVNRCIETFGSAVDALSAAERDLAAVDGISPNGAKKLHAAINDLSRDGAAQAERERAANVGAQLIALDESAYPRLLRHIPDPPPMLWVRGELRDEDALALGMVGARKCTHYGREQADRFAMQCAEAGLCIVSGGAHGIDGAAHRAALRAKGRTIAVLGSGLSDPYPKAHHELFDQIADPGANNGAVISEMPMQTPPLAEHFPRRNRIISGLSLGVLVIEAAKRSGALITARLCVEEHGRELLAVPGRVDSRASEGCHKIIREGWATLATNVADVLDALGEAGQLLKRDMTARRDDVPANSETLFDHNLTETQQKIMEALDEPRTLDQLTTWTGLGAAQLQSDLTLLELRGTLRREQGLFHKHGKK